MQFKRVAVTHKARCAKEHIQLRTQENRQAKRFVKQQQQKNTQ